MAACETHRMKPVDVTQRVEFLSDGWIEVARRYLQDAVETDARAGHGEDLDLRVVHRRAARPRPSRRSCRVVLLDRPRSRRRRARRAARRRSARRRRLPDDPVDRPDRVRRRTGGDGARPPRDGPPRRPRCHSAYRVVSTTRTRRSRRSAGCTTTSPRTRSRTRTSSTACAASASSVRWRSWPSRATPSSSGPCRRRWPTSCARSSSARCGPTIRSPPTGCCCATASSKRSRCTRWRAPPPRAWWDGGSCSAPCRARTRRRGRGPSGSTPTTR